MKRIAIALLMLALGFVGGIIWERQSTNFSIDDIEQVANAACDVRIKIMKESCKK